jgi:hypothetical protein
LERGPDVRGFTYQGRETRTLATSGTPGACSVLEPGFGDVARPRAAYGEACLV